MSRDSLPGFDLVESMDISEMREYVRSLLWQMRLCDAFWFMKVEEEHGLKSAELLNQRVWSRLGNLGARDLLERFGPFDKGVRGFWEAYTFFPWTIMVDYVVHPLPDGSMEVAVTKCPAQEGRRKHGLGEYVCKKMHYEEFLSFAKVVDPRVKVECLYAPPDPRPGECDCKWRFTLDESA